MKHFKNQLHHIYTPEELTELLDKYYRLEVIRTHEKLQAGAGEFFRKRTCLAKMRNYTMLHFFVYQGLTTSEVLSLKTKDVHLHEASVTIGKATQGNNRTLPLNAMQTEVLEQYLKEIRPQLETTTTDDTLFLALPTSNYRTNKSAEVYLKHFVKQLKRIDRNFEGFTQLRVSVVAEWIKNFGLCKAQYMAG